MPTTRRKTSTNSQQTLAFGPHSNKVTKPSATTSAKNIKASPSQLSKAISTTPEVQDIKPTKVEKEEIPEILNADRGLAFRVQGIQPKDELDEKARKIPEKQIKAYWRTQEDERKAPRGMYPSLNATFSTHTLTPHCFPPIDILKIPYPIHIRSLCHFLYFFSAS